MNERAWARQILREWRWFNWSYLRDALREPVVEISAGKSTLGQWQRETRTLTISGEHIRKDSWFAVLETLRHEMAHQYVDEVLRVRNEPPHGPAFRRACKKLRVSHVASGTGNGNPPTEQRARVLVRVEKLLALGESPNQNEADQALQKARELLLKHNLEDLDVRREFGFRQLGRPAMRRHHHESQLANVLAQFFFVESIWVHVYLPESDRRAQVLEIHGTQTNLELAEYVHGYVSSLLEPLWAEHKQKLGIASNRERLRFFAGVVCGFEESLRQQEHRLQERALVWTGDPGLEKHFRWHYPRTKTSYYGGGQQTQTYHDGVREGRSVRLRRPLQKGGGFGGLLTSG